MTMLHDASPNRRARFATWLARSSSRPRTARRTLLFLLCAIAWLTLCGIGVFVEARAGGAAIGPALADGFYGALSFLTPQTEYVRGTPLGVWRAIGRFFGVLLPVLGLYWVALRWVGGALAAWLLRHGAAGHAVLIGHGGSADRIATASVAPNAVIVLIDPHPREDRADPGGVIRLTEAGGTLFDRAASITVWTDSDARAVTTAIDLRDSGAARCDIDVRIEQPDTQRALRYARALLEDGPARLRPIAQTHARLRHALCDASLVRDAIEAGAPRVHVRLIGDTPALGEAAVLILRHNWSTRLGPPAIAADPIAASPGWQAWREHHAGFLTHAASVFEPGAVPTICFGEEPAQVTRYIVDLGDDDRTMAHALNLAVRLAAEDGTPPPVQVILHDADASGALLAATGLAFAPPILVGRTGTLAELRARDGDREAAQVHLAYLAQSAEASSAPDTDWRKLAETFIHASRASADHRRIKRYESGLTPPPDAEAMARVEHHRWCAERLLDGWTPGARDNARRRHPDLVPWLELTEEGREKDRVQVAATD
jgi:hypothetical protein